MRDGFKATIILWALLGRHLWTVHGSYWFLLPLSWWHCCTYPYFRDVSIKCLSSATLRIFDLPLHLQTCMLPGSLCFFKRAWKVHPDTPDCLEIFPWERPCCCSITALCLVAVLSFAMVRNPWHETVFHNLTYQSFTVSHPVWSSPRNCICFSSWLCFNLWYNWLITPDFMQVYREELILFWEERLVAPNIFCFLSVTSFWHFYLTFSCILTPSVLSSQSFLALHSSHFSSLLAHHRCLNHPFLSSPFLPPILYLLLHLPPSCLLPEV